MVAGKQLEDDDDVIILADRQSVAGDIEDAGDLFGNAIPAKKKRRTKKKTKKKSTRTSR